MDVCELYFISSKHPLDMNFNNRISLCGVRNDYLNYSNSSPYLCENNEIAYLYLRINSHIPTQAQAHIVFCTQRTLMIYNYACCVWAFVSMDRNVLNLLIFFFFFKSSAECGFDSIFLLRSSRALFALHLWTWNTNVLNNLFHTQTI